MASNRPTAAKTMAKAPASEVGCYKQPKTTHFNNQQRPYVIPHAHCNPDPTISVPVVGPLALQATASPFRFDAEMERVHQRLELSQQLTMPAAVADQDRTANDGSVLQSTIVNVLF